MSWVFVLVAAFAALAVAAGDGSDVGPGAAGRAVLQVAVRAG